jgi:glycine cleavage system H lipoate-binding protein
MIMDPIDDKKENDSKCIWMSAGIVNYKLCDQNFNCEGCEFNRVMQGAMPHLAQQLEPQEKSNGIEHPELFQCLASILEGCKIHLDRYYHHSHFWLKCLDQNTVSVGLDPLSYKIAYPVKRIILPEVGEFFHKGQLISWLVRKENTIPLYSPLQGEIMQVNPLFLLHGAEMVQREDSYLFMMYAEDIMKAVKKSCGSIGGSDIYGSKISILKTFLQKNINAGHSPEIGITLADGGACEKDIEKIIGAKLYQEMIYTLFHRK